MRYAAIRSFDVTNGEGNGISLFVQGCPFHCKYCFNPETWDFIHGKEWTPEIEESFINLANRDYIKRITILGGSPLCDENVCDVMRIVQKIRNRYPNKMIWVYTGYTWESIISPVILDDLMFTIRRDARMEVLKNIDVLVDGQFEYDKKDFSLKFRGSSNQRLINVQKSLKAGKVILWE